MSKESIERWMRDRGLDNTKAAATFNISFPMLGQILRGLEASPKTYQKIKDGMSAFEEEQARKRAS